MKPAFAIWITGLPSSGKSTLATALVVQLAARGIDTAVLESDVLRRIFTPSASYTDDERNTFYRSIAFAGKLLVDHGIPVVFDATANRRAYRDCARAWISHFLEVYVDCPLAVCIGRDTKNIYKKALEGTASTVPGLQTPYEPPERPDLVIAGDHENPESAARRVIGKLVERGYLRTHAEAKNETSTI